MKIKPKVVIALSTLLFSTSAFAQCQANYCSGKVSDFAASLKIDQQVKVSLLRSLDIRELACDVSAERAVLLPSDSAKHDAMYSLLLAAFAANSHIELTFSASSRVCEIESVALTPAN